MLVRFLCLLCATAALAGCATVAPAPDPGQVPWHDAEFAWSAGRVTLSRQDVFRLDPQLALALADEKLQRLAPIERSERLVTLLFGPKRDQFMYEAGHTTVAADSWQRRRGDCLSLTVLAYSAARALGLQAHVREVDIPSQYVRRDGFEFASHHVNLTIAVPGPSRGLGARELTIDFDPDASPWQRGRDLSELAVVARVYNNLAAEALTSGDPRAAYAYLKAAVATDPAYAASYTNLAVLYHRDRRDGDVEWLLRRAVALDDQPEAAMHALIALLQGQGRDRDAQVVAAHLRARQEADPYYWIGLGGQRLDEGRPADAARALERAQALADGFPEVHRLLMKAYLQLGKREQARAQMALLAAAESPNAPNAPIKKKAPPQ